MSEYQLTYSDEESISIQDMLSKAIAVYRTRMTDPDNDDTPLLMAVEAGSRVFYLDNTNCIQETLDACNKKNIEIKFCDDIVIPEVVP